MLNARSESQLIQYLVDHWDVVLNVPGFRVEAFDRPPAASGDGEPDLKVRASWRGRPIELLVEVKPARYMAEIAQASHLLRHAQNSHPDAIAVLVAPHLSKEQQRRCRSLGLNFLDLSGNAWLDAGSFYLDRLGHPNKFKEQRRAKDVFSDKASLVLRVLLEAPSRPAGIREIADRVAVSPGWVSQVVSRLQEMGYAASGKKGVSIHNAGELLQDWASAYSYKKNAGNAYYLSYRSLEEGLEAFRRRAAKVPDLPQHALSLQAGASLVAPHAVVPQIHAYVLGDSPDERASGEDLDDFAEELGLRSVAERGNVHLMSPYYAHGVRHGVRRLHGHPVVSDLQLFLDLYKYPVRGREQAAHLLDTVLRPRLARADAAEASV